MVTLRVPAQRGTEPPWTEPLSSLERAAAAGLAVLVGLHFDVIFGLRADVIVALLLIPLWASILQRYRFTLPLLVAIVAAATSGVVLSQVNSDIHNLIQAVLLTRTAMLLGLAVSVGALLWARRKLGIKGMAVCYSFGLLASIAINHPPTDNPWRFTYSIPITVFTLALAWVVNRWWVEIGCLVVLALIGTMNDSRSNSAMLLVAAVLVAWQAVNRTLFGQRRRAPVSLVGIVLIALSMFYLVQAAILEGYFGEATEQRTQAQIQQSGSVLLGGRPEIAASVALIGRYPWGLGSGLRASLDDVMHAKSAMSGIGYDPNNGYVERFMFGSGVEVHSVLGDAWVWFGPLGAVVFLVVAGIVVLGLQDRLRVSAMSGLFAYLTIRLFWDLMFSPLATSLNLLPLTLALAFMPRPRTSSVTTSSSPTLAAPS